MSVTSGGTRPKTCGRYWHVLPVLWVGVAGGDTSSFAVDARGVWRLQHIGRLGPGVSLVHCLADDARFDGFELMLKGTQTGHDDLLRRLPGQVQTDSARH